MSAVQISPFGRAWFDALATSVPSDGDGDGDTPRSVRVGALDLAGEAALVLAVVPDPEARFPRARCGETGLEEGWSLASVVQDVIEADRSNTPRPIVIVVDVPSQAYGYVEEVAGVHQSLAAAADAIARARLGGHPVTALVVGEAISGALLAVGLQANRILALDHPGVAVQVMSQPAAARITRRTVAELEAIARRVPATASDVRSFASLGALHAVLAVDEPAQPTGADVDRVVTALIEATVAARADGPGLESRLLSDAARVGRAASILVRRRVRDEWND